MAIGDLLLKNGTIIDPANGVNTTSDVFIQNGLISAVGKELNASTETRVIDVSNKVVTPGLIDIHGHFYDGGNGSSVHADSNCLPYGATTGVDAGSSGYLNYKAMRDYVFPTHKTTLLCFLHISAIGLAPNRQLGGGLHDMNIISIEDTVAAIKENPGFCFGVKVRMHYNAVSYWDAEKALCMAKEAAVQSGTRLMVHVSGTPIPLPTILKHMTEGDIATHVFNGDRENILDNHGNIRSEVKDAADRGIVFDVGHAGIHCDMAVVRSAISQDIPIDTISTDLHISPDDRTVYKMNDLVSQFHAVGLSWDEAIAAATTTPAKVLGLAEYKNLSDGTLSVGSVADVAVFDLLEGRFVWHDMSGNMVEGKTKLDTVVTIINGQIVWSREALNDMGEC